MPLMTFSGPTPPITDADVADMLADLKEAAEQDTSLEIPGRYAKALLAYIEERQHHGQR